MIGSTSAKAVAAVVLFVLVDDVVVVVIVVVAELEFELFGANVDKDESNEP